MMRTRHTAEIDDPSRQIVDPIHGIDEPSLLGASWRERAAGAQGALELLGRTWSEVGRDRRRTESRLRASLIVVGALTVGTFAVHAVNASQGGGAHHALPESPPVPTAAVVQSATALPLTTAVATGVTPTPGATTGGVGTAVVGTGGVGTTVAGTAVATTAALTQQPSTAQRSASPAAGQSTPGMPSALGTATPTGLRGSSSPPTPAATSAATSSVASAALAATPRSTPAAGQRTHTVRAGDTLLEVAVRNRTTVDALVQLNNLRSANAILSIGQKLVLP